LPEHSYHATLSLELNAAAIPYVSDRPVVVRYRGVVVGWHRPDFVVDQKVVLELKATEHLDPVHAKQVLTYLKVTGLRVGLLLNFGAGSLGDRGIRRFVL
jgi:GxxExxY protein